MAAVDATDWAIEGTVICANRADGLVARAGSAVSVAASGRGGMARGSAGATGLDLAAALAGTALGFAAALAAGLALGIGTAFLAIGLAVFSGIFFAGALAAGFTAVFLAGAALACGLAGTFLAGAFLAAAPAAGLADLDAGLALAGLPVFTAGLVALALAFG